jgi:hypothetical protein
VALKTGPKPLVAGSSTASKIFWSTANVSPGDSGIPLLALCDPGFETTAGVSKPVGASVAPCCAKAANTINTALTGRMRRELLFRITLANSCLAPDIPVKNVNCCPYSSLQRDDGVDRACSGSLIG